MRGQMLSRQYVKVEHSICSITCIKKGEVREGRVTEK